MTFDEARKFPAKTFYWPTRLLFVRSLTWNGNDGRDRTSLRCPSQLSDISSFWHTCHSPSRPVLSPSISPTHSTQRLTDDRKTKHEKHQISVSRKFTQTGYYHYSVVSENQVYDFHSTQRLSVETDLHLYLE